MSPLGSWAEAPWPYGPGFKSWPCTPRLCDLGDILACCAVPFLNAAPAKQLSFVSCCTMAIPLQSLWFCSFSYKNAFSSAVPFCPPGVSSERLPRVTFLEQPSLLPLLIPCPYFISFLACLTCQRVLSYHLLVHCLSPHS